MICEFDSLPEGHLLLSINKCLFVIPDPTEMLEKSAEDAGHIVVAWSDRMIDELIDRFGGTLPSYMRFEEGGYETTCPILWGPTDAKTAYFAMLNPVEFVYASAKQGIKPPE